MSVADVLALARPEIARLKPYSSARMEAGEVDLALDANELPWSPSGREDSGLNRYPPPQPAPLRARLAEFYAVQAEEILLTRGSGEGIDLLLRAFCHAGRDAIVISSPTFGLYAVQAAIQGAEVIEVPLDAGFQPSPTALDRSASDNVKLVFLCSPNNPTGNRASIERISAVASALAGRALLVVDEAYIEFAETSGAATLLARHANLVVLRTLSKVWGLAGARVGALLARREIVALLRRILAPYPLAEPAITAALATLGDEKTMWQRVALLRRERERMEKALRALPQVRCILPSDANFLAVRFHEAGRVFAELRQQGIAVRDLRGQEQLDDALRITLGTPGQNNRLLEAFSRMPLGEVTA
jgi:histidinol-phosphate aminotransferase